MNKKLCILLIFNKLKVTKLLIDKYRMHNLYAIFAKFLNICKQVSGNLVENLCLKMGKYKGLSDLSGRNCYLVAENLSALICLSSLSQIAKETLSLQIL